MLSLPELRLQLHLWGADLLHMPEPSPHHLLNFHTFLLPSPPAFPQIPSALPREVQVPTLHREGACLRHIADEFSGEPPWDRASIAHSGDQPQNSLWTGFLTLPCLTCPLPLSCFPAPPPRAWCLTMIQESGTNMKKRGSDLSQ